MSFGCCGVVAIVQNATTGQLTDTVPWSRYGGSPADPSWSAAFPQTTYVRWAIDGDSYSASALWGRIMLYFENIAEQVRCWSTRPLPAVCCSLASG